MRKFFIISIAILMSYSISIAGDEPTPNESIWEKLRVKIENLTPKKKLIAVTAVGGVRGAKNESEELYWKDEAKEADVSEEELLKFSTVVQAASEAPVEKALELLNGYISENPNSYFVNDAKEAVAQLQPAKK